MRNDETPQWLIALFMAFMVGLLIGIEATKEYYRDKAVEAGVAEWRIDPKTGDKEFVYITKEWNNELQESN